MHIHISTADGTAKFWLEPIVALADFYNLNAKELRKIELMVQERQNEFITAWRRHFTQ